MNLLPSPNPAIVVLDPRQVQPDDSDSEGDTENENENETEIESLSRLPSLTQRQTGRSLSLTQALPSACESGSTQTHKSQSQSHSHSQSRGSRRSRSSLSFSASSSRSSFAQTTGASVLPVPPLPAFAGAFGNLEREAEQHRNVAPPGDLFKTEMCRSYEENGWCRYGPKCQFAHGYEELRQPPRHPKYKTEICKTFHSIGTCQYGKRCRFIHNTAAPAADTERPPTMATTPIPIPVSVPPQANPVHSSHGASNTNTNTLSTTPDDFFGKSLLPPPTSTTHGSLPLLLPLPLPYPYPYTFSQTPATIPATATAAPQPHSPLVPATAPPLHPDDSFSTPAHSPFRSDSATWSYASPFLASDTSSLASDLSDNGVRSRSSSTRSRGDSVRRRLHIFEELGNAWDTQPLQTAVSGMLVSDSVPKVLVIDTAVDLALDLDFEISSPTFNASVMASVDAILDDAHE